MKLSVNRDLKTPLYLQIASQIKEQVLTGQIADGYALPSERVMAKTLNVHRNTVVKAYNELRDQELLRSYQGIGYRISYKKEQPKKRPKKVHWSNIIKEEYLELNADFDDLYGRYGEESQISFAAGAAARNVYSKDDVAACLADILSENNKSAYFYTPYQGDKELRQEISYFMRTKGILTNPSHIQIFSENNQALDFLVTMLLSPGDKIIMEESASPDVFRAMELAGGEIITIPMDENGMMCDCIEPILEMHRPKFIYVNSSYHNPSGVTLSMERRKKLLELSYEYRIPIIEEDEASELYFGDRRIPSIKSMDPGNNVIYMYSFSLTLIPGVGIAFVVASGDLIKSLSNLVSVRLVSLDWMPQQLTREYMKRGSFYNRLEDFRKVYRKKQGLMCRYLDEVREDLGLSYRRPEGGVYLWLSLPPSINGHLLLKESKKRGVTFMPGDVFYPDKNPKGNYIRLNYSYATEREIHIGMGILVELMQKIQKKI